MSQQQPDQNLAHMNAMNMSVVWSNGQMPQHMVASHHHHSPEPDLTNDPSHLIGIPMADQMSQHHMYAVQQQMPQHHQMQAHPQHQVQHHQGPPMHHHSGMHQQHMHQQQMGMMAHHTNLMDVSNSSIGTSASVSFVGDEDSREGGNNNEMRNLFKENENRSLDDVAKELHQNDRGPNSERLRQVFAMLWLSRQCERSRTSVPRGRVYAAYASKCANENITVLNPASFGKLVRILYPGLRTRRLGVRGESKYHYVNFSLKAEADTGDFDQFATVPSNASAPMPSAASQASASVVQREESILTSTTLTTSNGPASTRGSQSRSPRQTNSQIENQTTRRESKLEYRKRANRIIFEPGQDLGYVNNSKIKATKIEAPYSRNFPVFDHVSADPMALPDMGPYLPADCDKDAQMTLAALYRSHCTAMIDNVRYCREKYFWHHLSAFQGTLTVPVSRLLRHNRLAEWIEHCDTLMYQRLVRLLGFLLLQVLPVPVVECFNNIASNLIPYLRKAFANFPDHIIVAKIRPASIFSSIVRQALRVNVTAHAAASMLTNIANRDVMYSDLLVASDVRRMAEALPESAIDNFIRMCQTKVRRAINPENIDSALEAGKIFGQGPFEPYNGNETPLDLWVQFLYDLPSCFPDASAEDLVTHAQNMSTLMTRDLTITQGNSFGSWWVTKCWLDEHLAFLATSAGFLDLYSTSSSSATPAPVDTNIGANALAQAAEMIAAEAAPQSQHLNQDLQVKAEMGDFQGTNSGATETKFPNSIPSNLVAEVNGGDDSGIGIRTPEEDYVTTYEFNPGEQAEMGAPQTQ